MHCTMVYPPLHDIPTTIMDTPKLFCRPSKICHVFLFHHHGHGFASPPWDIHLHRMLASSTKDTSSNYLHHPHRIPIHTGYPSHRTTKVRTFFLAPMEHLHLFRSSIEHLPPWVPFLRLNIARDAKFFARPSGHQLGD